MIFNPVSYIVNNILKSNTTILLRENKKAWERDWLIFWIVSIAFIIEGTRSNYSKLSITKYLEQ